jgi:hypothetical protein
MIAMGAVFLACKIEENNRKGRDVVMVMDQVFKVFINLFIIKFNNSANV